MSNYADMLKNGKGILVLYLCNMLYNGEGIQINKKEAAKYFKIATDECDTQKGDGISMNKEDAEKYLKMAADEGLI